MQPHWNTFLGNLRRLLNDRGGLNVEVVEDCLQLVDVNWLKIGDGFQAKVDRLCEHPESVEFLLTPKVNKNEGKELFIFLKVKVDSDSLEPLLSKVFGQPTIFPSRTGKGEAWTYSSDCNTKRIHFLFDVKNYARDSGQLRTLTGMIVEG